MKIFLDTSDVNVIKHHYQTGLVDGVTTKSNANDASRKKSS